MTTSLSDRRPRVLVVDDIPSVIRLLALTLGMQGWDVMTAEVGEQVFEEIERQPPDLVLLEVMLPGVSGFEVLRRIRESYGIPVVFVTSQGTEADRAYGFELGAADYVTKPFNPTELSARLSAVLDAKPSPGVPIMRFGTLEIDLRRMLARRQQDFVSLATNEWALIYTLANQIGQSVPARELLLSVWGDEYAGDIAYLEAWIERLRKKIEPFPNKPQVLTGDARQGYTLHPGDTELQLSPSRLSADSK